MEVEDYRDGYPRLSALISAYEGWFICRRFKRLRIRLLLTKQDQLFVLEQQLDQIDEVEMRPLFLGSMRCDRNNARQQVLSEIQTALNDYGRFST